MDMQNDEITIDDFKNYIEDISKFMKLQQIESGTYKPDSPDDFTFEFRNMTEH